MQLSSFTTRRGNVCVQLGSGALYLQACVAGAAAVALLKRHPVLASALIAAPFLIQLYLASRQPENDNINMELVSTRSL